MLGQSRHLPNGQRITDELAMGILAKRYPTAQVKEILQRTGRANRALRKRGKGWAGK